MISDTNENSQVKLLNDRRRLERNAVDFIPLDSKKKTNTQSRLGNKG